MKAIENIVEIILDFNKNGNSFPLWTTCLGYEGMMLALSDYSLKWKLVNSRNHSLSILPSQDFDQVFKSKSISINSRQVQDWPFFYFNHHFGFDKDQILSNPKAKEIQVLAEAELESGLNVVSLVKHS